MAARAIWKGDLRLDSTKVPVKLYSALQDQTVRFHILDERSKTRVKQHMVDSDSGEEVSNEEIQKGFEVEPGTFVILDEKELKSLEPKPSREIEITKFVPPAEIAPEYYDRPYYLGPDGDQTAYFGLAEALRNKEKEGIAHWVMRKQPYVGALRAEGDHAEHHVDDPRQGAVAFSHDAKSGELARYLVDEGFRERAHFSRVPIATSTAVALWVFSVGIGFSSSLVGGGARGRTQRRL